MSEAISIMLLYVLGIGLTLAIGLVVIMIQVAWKHEQHWVRAQGGFRAIIRREIDRQNNFEQGAVAMAEGTVKFFNDEKGWGFIKPDDAGDDLFVHYSGIVGSGGRRTLADGERVRFRPEHTARGAQAMDVEVIS